VEIGDAEREAAFCHSRRSLGHGRLPGMVDIVAVDPETFDPSRTRDMAREIAAINSRMEKDGTAYLLVGPGRWGSFDPWLGIPVKWRDISGVAVMVELSGADRSVEPSFGSHFFQRITSRGIPYVTVSDGTGDDFFDWNWVRSLPRIHSGRFLSCYRSPKPFRVKVDGRRGRCVMVKP
jgi:hypothetical protein